MKQRFAILIALPLFMLVMRVAGAEPKVPPRGHCRIETTRILKSGKEDVAVSWVDVASAKDCARHAKLHKTNYTPQDTISKRVGWKWE